jgi:hypothetical protein
MSRPGAGRDTYDRKEAYRIYKAALRSGELVPATECERCGAHSSGRALDGHHPDLTHKPLRVNWLCRLCHARQHYWDLRAGLITMQHWQTLFPDVEIADAYEPLPDDPPTWTEYQAQAME